MSRRPLPPPSIAELRRLTVVDGLRRYPEIRELLREFGVDPVKEGGRLLVETGAGSALEAAIVDRLGWRGLK